MALYMMQRELGGSAHEYGSLADVARCLSAIPCLRWGRSFVAPATDRLLSVHEADWALDVERAVVGLGLVWSDLMEVEEIDPTPYVRGFDNAPAPGSALHAIFRQFAGPITDLELEASAYRSAACMLAFGGLTWDRSYWSAERRHAICLYHAVS